MTWSKLIAATALALGATSALVQESRAQQAAPPPPDEVGAIYAVVNMLYPVWCTSVVDAEEVRGVGPSTSRWSFITFNYDLALDVALCLKNFNVDYGLAGRTPRTHQGGRAKCREC